MGKKKFVFKPNDLVLVKWNDGIFYYAKVSKIFSKSRKCVVVFDDKSKETVKFRQIFDVNATTTEVEFCMKCKHNSSFQGNMLVFCDRCNACYHQKCHLPAITDKVLQSDNEWVCTYCEQQIPCPYLVNQDEVVSALYTSPEKKAKVSSGVEGESFKRKQRKLAALNGSSHRRTRSPAARSDGISSQASSVPKLSLDFGDSSGVSDTNGEESQSVVQIPFSALTPERFPTNSPLFTAVKDHWSKKGNSSTAPGDHPSVSKRDPAPSTEAERELVEQQKQQRDQHKSTNGDTNPLFPPSPCASDGEEEFEEIFCCEEGNHPVEGDSDLHGEIEVKPIVKQSFEDSDVVLTNEDQCGTNRVDSVKSDPLVSAEKLFYDISPATCVVQVTLPNPICLAIPGGWKGKNLMDTACIQCGKKAGFLCSGCKAAWYCSSACQYEAWPRHIKQCENLPLSQDQPTV